MSNEARELNKLHSYTAYGLQIQAAFPIPELTSGLPGATPHISILFNKLPPAPSGLHDEEGIVLNTSGGVYFYWRHLGGILARDGCEIFLDLLPGVAVSTVRLFLLGSVLGVLLHQRGLFTLHASTVAIDGSAVAFIGAKEAGKSTMAAALYQRGHALVTDDILALDLRRQEDDYILAFPGFPQFKLWPASARALSEDPDKLSPVHPELEKRALRPSEGFQETPLPLKRIYVLSEGAALSSHLLSAREAFVQLLSHSYAARFLGEGGAGPAHFLQCHRLVQQVPIYRLQRPFDLSQLPSVVRFIEADVNRSG